MTPAVVLGIALLAIYWAWIALFFHRVRPWLSARIGSALGVRVRESKDVLDAGTWDASGKGATLPKSGLVMAADFAILLVGTVGVAALIFVPAFLVGESGALLPIEARLTGRGATLRAFDAGEMASTERRARIALDVHNTGRDALRDCYGLVDGYRASNGYLHGRTERFDLGAGERKALWIELEAMRPPPGTHAFRLKLECANERLAVAEAVLKVR